ncbi:MAG: GSCFA domain-containing protein, partial [Bacteroidales bacterium]|nr:GSCFA domain-containing protein [Bacteroidales bacterium]
MLRLQTPVTDERCKVGISYSDKIMMLGSCFSENIGVQLKNFGFDVCINPFGVLYNPVSVLNSVERMLDIRQFSLEDCIQIGAGDTRFCSFSHHTSFA